MALRQIAGENIKKYRLEKGFTQQTLAYKAKISISCLRNIEHGKENITIDLLENLAYSLGVEPEILLKNSQSEQPSVKKTPEK